MATSKVTDATRAAICKLLAWDFAQLQAGAWDFVDHTGKFHKSNSPQEKRSGEQMPIMGVPS